MSSPAAIGAVLREFRGGEKGNCRPCRERALAREVVRLRALLVTNGARAFAAGLSAADDSDGGIQPVGSIVNPSKRIYEPTAYPPAPDEGDEVGA